MNSEELIPVANILPLMFLVGIKNQWSKDSIHGYWYPDIWVEEFVIAGVPVEEVLADIGMGYIKTVVYLEFTLELYCIRSLEYV